MTQKPTEQESRVAEQKPQGVHCPDCGHETFKNRKDIRQHCWECEQCGNLLDRTWPDPLQPIPKPTESETPEELAIHVHRAADKLFERDLIDPPTLRYDYLYAAVEKLHSYAELQRQLAQVTAERDAYLRAVQFYAEPNHYKMYLTIGTEHYQTPKVSDDKGKVAREALESTKAKT